MIRLLSAVVITCIGLNAGAINLRCVVIDENKMPLQYTTIRVVDKQIGALSDNNGSFSISSNSINKSDSVTISYLGYTPIKLTAASLCNDSIISVELTPAITKLDKITVLPQSKQKSIIRGKKSSRGIMKSYLDGNSAGDCFGYEFHTPKNKRLYLNKVGFYYCEGDSQMTNMNFRINVYDMSKVSDSMTTDFVNVLPSPIYFSYTSGAKSGKFEHTLSDIILLPTDAMVEIEMLDNLGDKKLWFKSNLVGKQSWTKTLNESEWMKMPFAAPFFVECIEIADKEK